MTARVAGLQAKRTRAAIWNALVELLEERSLSSISIKEVCERAQVHRVTFYRHFESKRDLVDRGGAELIAGVAQGIPPARTYAQLQQGEPPENLVALFRYAGAHAAVFRVLLREPGGEFRASLSDLIAGMATDRLEEALDENDSLRAVPAGLAASFAGGAVVGCLEWWLNQPADMPAREAAGWLGALLAGGFVRTVGNKGHSPH